MNTLKFASLQSETSFGDKSFSALASSEGQLWRRQRYIETKSQKQQERKLLSRKTLGEIIIITIVVPTLLLLLLSAASPPLSSRSSSRQVALWDEATGCDLWWKTMISITTATSSRAQKYFFCSLSNWGEVSNGVTCACRLSRLLWQLKFADLHQQGGVVVILIQSILTCDDFGIWN